MTMDVELGFDIHLKDSNDLGQSLQPLDSPSCNIISDKPAPIKSATSMDSQKPLSSTNLIDQSLIGRRVFCEGHSATIKWAGILPRSSDLWYGIEYDESEFGRLNGTYFGRSFFTTRFPTSGDFVRPAKVRMGKSCFEVIENKYTFDPEHDIIKKGDAYARMASTRGGSADAGAPELVLAGGRKDIETVGWEKVARQQSLAALRVIDLRGTCVEGAGSEDELTRLATECPRVHELDLSRTLLASWLELARIARSLPELASLFLGENRMPAPLSLLEPTSSDQLAELTMPANQLAEFVSLAPFAFANIKVLHLKRMNYAWPQVAAVCAFMPALQDLHACFNKIIRIQPSTSSESASQGGSLQSTTAARSLFPALEHLCLESNPLEGWEELLTLSSNMPRLQSLTLCNTNIKSISFPSSNAGSDNSKTVPYFKSLKTLNISGNLISKWSDLSQLERLESLVELRLQGNPVMGRGPRDTASPPTVSQQENGLSARQQVIALLSRVALLNGSPVKASERRGAELDYLKAFAPDWLRLRAPDAPQEARTVFLREHPRYLDLVRTYGAAEEGELKKAPRKMTENLLSVHIELRGRGPSQSTEEQVHQSLERSLPPGLELAKLRRLLARLLNLPDPSFALSYFSHTARQEYVMDNDLRSLAFYDVANGDTLIVRTV